MGANLIMHPFPADCRSVGPAKGFPVSRNCSSAQATVLPLDDMIGGGPFDLLPGQWTDDTSMALCLATSLLECNGFDPRE